jgi:hypothetical protein
MALAMPRPFATKSGCYYLNVRVPNELREVARGRLVNLPIDGESVTVTVSDKVYVSLRTKSAREAKDRFQIAFHRLAAYWDSLRAAPQRLPPFRPRPWPERPTAVLCPNSTRISRSARRSRLSLRTTGLRRRP